MRGFDHRTKGGSEFREKQNQNKKQFMIDDFDRRLIDSQMQYLCSKQCQKWCV